MRTEVEYRAVMALIEQGLNNSEIERRTGISRTTIREWRRGACGDRREGGLCGGTQSLEALARAVPAARTGPKHMRPIALTDWQQAIVDAHPRALVRGLIHSDGSRFMNQVRHGEKAYAYPRYNFTSASDDIRAIFTDALDRLGVAWRRMNARNISIARKDAVAALDAFVGPKR